MSAGLVGRGGNAWRTSEARWAALTHPARAREVFGEHLYRGPVEACQILQTRFRTLPAERARGAPVFAAVYRLRLPAGHQLLHLRAYEGRGRERFAAARRAARARPAFGPPIAYLPEFDAVVWAFPNDPGLPQLPDLVGDGVDVEILRWKPARRCVLRYRRRGAPDLVAKAVHHDRAPQIARRMRWMRRLARGDPDGFTTARPLGVTPALSTVWQEALPGVPLMDIVMAYGDPSALMAIAGRGLAHLHAAQPPAGLPGTSLADRLRFVEGGPFDLIRAHPQLRGRLESLVAELERQAAALGDARPRVVHGDFLLKQLVVTYDGRLGLFDFDDFMLGDCLEDIANCIADLHYWDIDPAAVSEMARDFLAAYRAHAHWPVPVDRVRWHMSVQLLRDAWYWYKRRQLEPGWAFELEALLLRAEDPPLT